ncbi:MAG: UpxY family transcription antiterminator [Candidatus Sulfotelmatobacter sp.]
MSQVIEMTAAELAIETNRPATGLGQGGQFAHWYAIYASPRHEKRVHEHLSYRNLECFLPLYRSVHRWKNGCKRLVELPLFPGYLFVKIGQEQRVRVLEIPGVLSFVGCKALPAQLSDFEIETLRSGLHLKKFAPYRDLVVGEKVRIKAGPLAGLAGVLVRTTNGLRVVLTLNMINQSVAVELDATDVEPLGSHHHPTVSLQPAEFRS